MPTRRHVVAGGLALAATPAFGRDATWPTQSIRLVVPFVAGGSTDVLARRLAEKLRVGLGQQVVVENRGGAGGTIGSDSVAKSAPDGSTLLLGVTGTHGTAPSIYPNLPYDPVHDFTPISRIATAPLVILVQAESHIEDLAAYIAAAKVQPGHVTYGTPGAGTSMHLSGVQFGLMARVNLTHVPYRGSAPAFSDLLGGRITSLFGDFLVALPQIRAGALRALAVTSPTRSPLLPDVPTVHETLPGYGALSWQGLFAPAGTPAPIVDRLHRETLAAMTAPDMVEFFSGKGFEVGATTPDEFRAFVQTEVARWARIVREGEVKIGG